jgi:Tfp pilus assembly protein FimT
VSILEVMMVLVMVGILSGIVASRAGYTTARADGAAHRVLAELSNAHRLAISLQANVRVTVPERGRMVIHADLDNNGSVGISERSRSVPLDQGLSFVTDRLGTLPTPADPTPLNLLVFRRDGSANRGGTFYLKGSDGDARCRTCRAIVVTRETGRVVLYSFATGNWARADHR